MTHTQTHSESLTAPATGNTEPAGAWLSIIGLIAWLAAMGLAVAGPLLNIHIPAALIVGMVVFSGIFSLLSLPRLLQPSDKDEPK